MSASAKAYQSSESAPLPSRREFLNYLLGASVALTAVASVGGVIWFTQQQRIGYGAKSGLFLLDLSDVPKPNDSPLEVRDAFAWLANIDGGLIAYSMFCPYRGCLVKWSASNWRFECPCCGSKFQIDGTYIEGPAPRGLDKLIVRVTTRYNSITTPYNGSPVSFEGATSVVLDTDGNQIIPGKPRPPRLYS